MEVRALCPEVGVYLWFLRLLREATKGVFLSLSFNCFIYCVCVHPPDFTLIPYTNLVFIAFKTPHNIEDNVGFTCGGEVRPN